MKKYFIFLFLFLFSTVLYAKENYISLNYISQSDNFEIIDYVQLCVDSRTEESMKITISKSIIPLPHVINSRITAEKNNDRYEFDFIDNFGNHAFGYLVFISPNMIEFYIDCSKFSDEGKNLGRLYGNKYLLVKTPYIIDPEDLVTK